MQFTRRRAIEAAVAAIAAPTASPNPSPQIAWWENETRMANGVLSFRDKPWFAKAQALKPGDRIYLDLNHDGIRDAIVFKDGAAIIEVIDDGLRWTNQTTTGDFIDSCWVINYDGNGLVDRMIDYVDNNGDSVADEVEFRYYTEGRLIWSWLFECLDGKWNGWAGWPHNWPPLASKWAIIPAGKTTEVFAQICRGNKSYAINKYDPLRDAYIPFSECPFAFFDLDGDGRSEAVVRVSAAPSGAHQDPQDGPGTQPDERWDYANSYAKIWGPIEPGMDRIGNLNVRYSFNLKNDDSEARPLAYDIGFTMVGRVPYDYPQMTATNLRRRHPKTFCRIAHARLREVAENYPADRTGFSWDEWADSVLFGGTRPVWEGVFWIYERHNLFNTGGPTRKWNIRREFLDKFASERRLYYSEIDRRIHLFGARDGWIEIGHVVGDEKIGEIRYFDTNGDGYFDRWEFDLDNDGRPERIVTVADPRAKFLAFDYESLSRFYTREVLPEAISRSQQFLAAVKKYVAVGSTVLKLEEMANASPLPERKRYLLDLVREYYYRALLDSLYQTSAAHPYALQSRDGKSQRTFQQGLDSERWWRRTAAISALDQAYNTGDYAAVLKYLNDFGPIREP